MRNNLNECYRLIQIIFKYHTIKKEVVVVMVVYAFIVTLLHIIRSLIENSYSFLMNRR